MNFRKSSSSVLVHQRWDERKSARSFQMGHRLPEADVPCSVETIILLSQPNKR